MKDLLGLERDQKTTSRPRHHSRPRPSQGEEKKDELQDLMASLHSNSAQLVSTLRRLEKSPRAAGELERIFGDESLCLRSSVLHHHWSSYNKT